MVVYPVDLDEARQDPVCISLSLRANGSSANWEMAKALSVSLRTPSGSEFPAHRPLQGAGQAMME
jgi:hypothetical protein